jgi:hypothetical protein
LGIDNFGTIDTGAGNDTIEGFAGRNGGINNFGTIDTGAGNDTIKGELFFISISNKENSTINTGAGNDIITGSGGFVGILNEENSTINTGAGNDSISGDGGNTGIFNNGTIDTGAGNDIIDIGAGNDITDALTGGFSGNGITRLGDGDDTIKGFGTGSFDGGNGNEDELLFYSGSYSVSDSANLDGFYTVTSGTTDMFVKNFEFIGSADNPAAAFSFSDFIGETFTV